MKRAVLLIAVPLEAGEVDRFRDDFEIVYAPSTEAFAALLTEGCGVQAIIARNAVPIGARELEALPKLELVVMLGSGTDAIDRAALAARGVRLATGHGVNATAVADHAMALLLASLRKIVLLDRDVHVQGWGRSCEPPASVPHTRLGIVGLGAIGIETARRAEAFGMTVAYHNRSQKAHSSYPFFPTIIELAEWADALLLCCTGGPTTRHLVNNEVLGMLGPQGHLVNVARGSVVDTAALIVALKEGTITAAALDVLDATPPEFEQLKALRNLIFTPHTAGRSPESLTAAIEVGLRHLREHFVAGQSSKTGVTY